MLGFDFKHMDCGECGIEFYVPDSFYKERRERKLGWTCPNGHSRIFSETESEKLRRERDRAVQQNARLADELREAAEAKAEIERRAARTERNLKRRLAAGSCPCCRRTFGNMAQHMRKQHPDFLATQIDGAANNVHALPAPPRKRGLPRKAA